MGGVKRVFKKLLFFLYQSDGVQSDTGTQGDYHPSQI